MRDYTIEELKNIVKESGIYEQETIDSSKYVESLIGEKGNQTGYVIRYNESDGSYLLYNIKNSKLHGYKYWFTDKRILSKCPYINDEKHGEELYYTFFKDTGHTYYNGIQTGLSVDIPTNEYINIKDKNIEIKYSL